eukprot:CAMPEP_0181473274 /NCGR_PEP_ID=MMETSP1110-20121109/40037_1 /TAXON_ID=174948 /ORGANISM="Symbiodinium sp., Strain CCMP421" /LENGTH=41 /DNA_ID= /DNA_START= /DNA_END= /DNA_ORIENTATION=
MDISPSDINDLVQEQPPDSRTREGNTGKDKVYEQKAGIDAM